MSTGTRLAILAAVIAVAVVGFVVASGGDDDKTDTTTTTAATTTETTASDGDTTASTTTARPAGPPTYRVTVAGGKPRGGVKRIEVDKGDTVRLVVRSDVADEIHIHGYDLAKDVEAGGSARFNFKATIDGSFEIELEGRGEQIAALTVQP